MTLIMGLTACGKKKDDGPVEKISVIGDVNETTLKLNANGSVIEIACEDFAHTEAAIDTSTLEEFIKSEIDKYNAEAGGNKITFLEYQNDDNFVRTAIQYIDIDTYNSFNLMELAMSEFNKEAADKIVKDEQASLTDAAKSIDMEEMSEEEKAELEEELAGAGYNLEDIESGLLDETASEGDADELVATFTDASTGSVVKSDEITDSSYMMIITDEPMNYYINGGKIVYYNKNCELVNETTVKVSGEGKAVIVYTFNF
jgi:hypothetical protein